MKRYDGEFLLKAVVMLIVMGVWSAYILSAVIRGNYEAIDLTWIGLPGAMAFALFGKAGEAISSRLRGGNRGDNGRSNGE